MDGFPRTVVGGVSVSRLIIGTNWFVGCSHTSKAKDNFLLAYQTRKNLADILTVFLERGVDTIMGGPQAAIQFEAIRDAEDRVGRKMILVLTPGFRLTKTGRELSAFWDCEAEAAFDRCHELGATFCLPHQSVVDALIDRRDAVIRDIDRYTKMIRERGMIPGLSTHMPEAIVYADRTGIDVETYIQPLNAAGFLMQVEADWVMRVIRDARKPVMTIKPLAAGRLLPAVGLAYSWNAIRNQDMVTIGTMTPDEAREVVDISLDLLSGRMPDNELQFTRSKRSLADAG